MKDNNHEKLEKDNSDEVPIFSDRDLEDYLKVEEEYSKGGEMPQDVDPPPQTLASLKRQRSSKRSLMFVALLCFGLGILVLAVFFVMKPEVRKPQIVAKRMKRPIQPIERKEEPMVPGAVGKKEAEEKLSEGGIPEKERPVVSAPSEPSMMIRERGLDKKVVILGGKELPKEEKEVKVSAAEVESPEITRKRETKPQFAKAEEPKIRGIPKQKLPIGMFTINVGSFKKRVRAERLMNELKEKGYKAFIAEATIAQRGTWYRVSVGGFSSRGEAQAFARALKEKEGLDSFVRKLKETER